MKKVDKSKMLTDKNLVLVGNPNTGKTTFFNAITNSDEHVGNWHGVTVDFKEKIAKICGENVRVTDLPGLYSLSSYSYEEAVARDYIYAQKGSIINLCDANNLARNLYLTLQLLEMGIKPIVCINMANEIKKTGKTIDVNLLSKKLNLDVFLIDAQNKSEVELVVQKSLSLEQKKARKTSILKKRKHNDIQYQLISKNQVNCLSLEDSYLNKLPLNKVKNIIADNIKNISFLSLDFVAVKVLEKDEYILDLLKLTDEQLSRLKEIDCDETIVATTRYHFIDQIIKDCVVVSSKSKAYGLSKLDKIVLNKYLALPIFLLILCLVFFLTFSSIGKFLSNGLNDLLEKFVFSPCLKFISSHTNNAFLISFMKDAIFGGVGSLVCFLPQITILFLSLSFLEDSGYMSRLAFTLEDFFSKIGLTGKSVFTLLMGFGCSTTSTMTSRNLEDKNSKIKTAMLSPYISCSAKIPLYTVICGAFFFKFQLLIIICLYILSVVIAVLVSYFLEKTVLKSGEQSFIMELPPYRLPKLKRILKLALSNIKSFVLRVGTMIISFSVIIWILQSCDFTFRFNAENSILKKIGQFLEPIFAPLGFGSWGAVVCLICGVVAKEIIVGTMGIINNVAGDISTNMLISESLLLSSSALHLNPCSALSFLVFSLLYLPCISTIGVMRKEIGKKWTLIALLIQFTIAYILSFAVYKIALCFAVNGTVSGIISVLIFVAIIVSLFIFKKFFKSKNKCLFCPKNKKCGDKKC